MKKLVTGVFVLALLFLAACQLPQFGQGGRAAQMQAPSCFDGRQNGAEVGIDCGGPTDCPRCLAGSRCVLPQDCQSGLCRNSICVGQATCFDRMQNQDESDTDCGGTVCYKCNNNQKCRESTDCFSGYCSPANRCDNRPETCYDKLKNQDETDVDCGGKCQKCDDGKSCIRNEDCATQFCGYKKVCATPAPFTATCPEAIAAWSSNTGVQFSYWNDEVVNWQTKEFERSWDTIPGAKITGPIELDARRNGGRCGEAIAVWENEGKIMAAHWNDFKWSTPKEISQGKDNHDPAVEYSNTGTALAVWVANAEVNPRAINSALWNGKSWEESQEARSTKGYYVSYPDIAWHAGKWVLVATTNGQKADTPPYTLTTVYDTKWADEITQLYPGPVLRDYTAHENNKIGIDSNGKQIKIAIPAPRVLIKAVSNEYINNALVEAFTTNPPNWDQKTVSEGIRTHHYIQDISMPDNALDNMGRNMIVYRDNTGNIKSALVANDVPLGLLRGNPVDSKEDENDPAITYLPGRDAWLAVWTGKHSQGTGIYSSRAKLKLGWSQGKIVQNQGENSHPAVAAFK